MSHYVANQEGLYAVVRDSGRDQIVSTHATLAEAKEAALDLAQAAEGDAELEELRRLGREGRL